MRRLAYLTALLCTAVFAFAQGAQASPSPPWNPTLCDGVKWTECTLLPGSECDAAMRDGQIWVRLDTCVEVWWVNERRKIRRHRITPEERVKVTATIKIRKPKIRSARIVSG